MKYILVIGDGMADDPIPGFDGKTPLQYANTPVMDKLTSAGVFGSVMTIPEGMQAGSDTAILSIFGCDPREYYSGRAPLEAAAKGLKLAKGDIAYRCNMISIEDGDIPFEEKKILSHSAGAISGEESDALVSELFNTPVFKEAAGKAGINIYPGSSFRHIAVKEKQGDGSSALFEDKAEEPSPCFSELTPPHDHLNEMLGQHLPKGTDNAAVLKNLIRLSYDILKDHPINIKRREAGKLPANCIWFWAEGTAVDLPDFSDRYGKTGCVISAVPLCQGIGTLMGLVKVVVEGATGELNTNYEGKVDAAVKALQTCDFATIHIEAPDECTHNGDIKGKQQAIEWIDSRILAPLLDKMKENKFDFRLLLMSDHRTLTSTRGHDSGCVPYVLYDSRVDKKTGKRFNEAEAEKGEYIPAATELMDLLFEDCQGDGSLDNICRKIYTSCQENRPPDNFKETGLAYAKINISLDIVSKMPDGYHNLKTVMQTVGLADEITIECKPGEGIVVEAGRPYLPGDERNIAAKAARIFYKHTGIEGYHTLIKITKNIPVCAGLGGGSTDGACVLRLMNKMFETGLGRETLEFLGNTIGSDVPFSIDGGTKLAEGRGEILTDLPPIPFCHVVICKPPFSCSTPELFGYVKCDKIRARPDTDGIIKALEEGNLGAIARRMYNVFEDVLPRGKQEIAEIKGALLDNNALGSIMTGSGSSVFGLFENKADALTAYEQLKKRYDECFLTETV